MTLLLHCLSVILAGAAFMTATATAANLRREVTTNEPLDLSKPFERSPLNNKSTCARQMIDFAAQKPEIQGLVALEHGKVVAEYSATGQIRPIWSCTKTFTAVLLGILVKDGYLSLDETLGDIFNYDPYNVIWGSISDADTRKALTIESILTMTAGLSLPDDWVADFMLGPFDYGKFGGNSLVDSLGYHTLNPSRTNKDFEYLLGGNLFSYVIAERTRMTPLEFAEMKLFPLLGITEPDYDWHHNWDGFSYAWHGIFMTAPSMAKLGMLYLQHGRVSAEDAILNESFVLDSTKGTVPNDLYGYGVWLSRVNGVDPVYPERATRYGAGGFGESVIGVNEDLDRVTAIVSNNYLASIDELGIEGATDELGKFMNDPNCSFSEE